MTVKNRQSVPAPGANRPNRLLSWPVALGAIITVFGVAGFGLRALGHVEPIAVVSGVLSGLTLLAFGLWAFTPGRTAP